MLRSEETIGMGVLFACDELYLIAVASAATPAGRATVPKLRSLSAYAEQRSTAARH
jgi:hypothetical protein